MCTALGAALGTPCVGVCAQPPAGPPPANVRLDAVKNDVVEQLREVTGELRSPRRSLVAAQQAGRVVEMSLQDGDAVKAGQVIARLDDTLAKLTAHREEATLAARRSAIAERESLLERAKRDLTRVNDIAARGSATTNEMDDAKTNVALVEARLAQAKSEQTGAEQELDLARERLLQMVVTAPFDGRVVRKATEVGQWLRAGDWVVEIVALDQVEARLDVPESLVARLPATPSAESSAMVIRVRVRALDREFEGTLAQIVPDADPLSRLFPVRVLIDNKDQRLRPGMSVVGLVPTGKREPTLTVHKDAVNRDDAGEFVYFDAGGTAAVARVRTLFAVGDRVAVQSDGLPPEAKVVVEGNERLNPGRALVVMGAEKK